MSPTDPNHADPNHADRHIDDEVLAALALGDTGDLITADTSDAEDHLSSCPQCSRSLASLRETLMLVSGGAEPLVPPPPSVWAGVQQVLADERDQVAEPERTTATVAPLAERRRGVPTWLAGLAAAAALVVGLGGGWLAGQLGDDGDEAPERRADLVASAELASLDEAAEDRGTAQVRRHDDRVVLHVEAADLGGPDGIREVWLINVDGSRMVSLGLLPDGEAGDFEFPERLLDEGYRIVDISYEPDDGDPVHSGESLARGTIEG